MDERTHDPFSRWLTLKLAELDWPNAKLAREVHVDTSQVSRWKSGEDTPTSENVIKIAEALIEPPDVLLDMTGHRPMPSTRDDPLVLMMASKMGNVTPAEIDIVEAVIDQIRSNKRA